MSKGSSPRSCFSKKFKENYTDIKWGPSSKAQQKWKKKVGIKKVFHIARSLSDRIF